jgi:GT2 family glycosyltransferase
MVSQEYPWVNLIQTHSNLGFAKGNNIGIGISRGKYLCLINSDVEVFPDTMSNLCEVMERHPQIGLIGPQVLNSDGTPQSNCRNAPTIWNTLCRAVSLDTLFPQYGVFRSGLALFPTGKSPAKVEVLTGCFWFVRREALESVGWLDEQFFMYGEDLDWCRRFRDRGWEVAYVASARAVHHGGASSAEAPIRFFIEIHRAQLQYWRKYHSKATSVFYLMTLWLHNIVRLIGYCISYLIHPRRRQISSLKVNRSWQCVKWLATEGSDYIVAKVPQSMSGKAS